MTVTFHRGAEEIGGTCVELSSNGCRILLDCGLPLTGADQVGRQVGDQLHLKRAFEGDSPVQGIVLSHAHPDHAGLIEQTDSSVPVLATRACFKMVMAASIFANQSSIDRERQIVLTPGEWYRIGPFTITPYSVDHSIAGSCAFIIEGEGKRILYTGDLRFHGRKRGMHCALIKVCQDTGIDLVITEGTSLSRSTAERTFTEQELESEAVSWVQDCRRLVATHFSPLNLDRLVSFIRVATRTGRVFVIDAYGAYVLMLAGSEGIKVPDPFTSRNIRILIPEGFWRTLQGRALSRHRYRMERVSIRLSELVDAPNQYLMLWRPSMLDRLFGGSMPEGTLCIRSLWKGYLESVEENQLATKFQEEGVDQRHLHSSGHASRTDLVKFLEGVSPKKIVVVHSERPEALQEHFSNVVSVVDGESVVA